MNKEKLTPVEWLLNELDERDMIDKTIYHEKDRTFESISEQALKMEQEYASQSKWISVDDDLPNKKGFYLCLMKESNDVVDCMYYDNETWWGSEEIYNNSEILLWQPLPPPPSNN